MIEYVFSPPPVPGVGIVGSIQRFPVHRVYCVGRNYAAHAREMGGHPDREPPFFFAKPADAVTQAATIPYPSRTADLHHEVELVVAIGQRRRGSGEDPALESVYGYAVGVDLTRRDLQAEARQSGRPWDTAKGFDQSAPVSDIRPVSLSGHPGDGSIILEVNGVTRQRGRLQDMIWTVAEIVAELSGYFELRPGDLVFTGTPAGVGPLTPGDRVTASVEGVGRLEFEMGNPHE